MRKTPDAELRETVITTVDKCPFDQSPFKVRVDIGLGVVRFKFKYCDTCGLVKELNRGKPISAH